MVFGVEVDRRLGRARLAHGRHGSRFGRDRGAAWRRARLGGRLEGLGRAGGQHRPAAGQHLGDAAQLADGGAQGHHDQPPGRQRGSGDDQGVAEAEFVDRDAEGDHDNADHDGGAADNEHHHRHWLHPSDLPALPGRRGYRATASKTTKFWRFPAITATGQAKIARNASYLINVNRRQPSAQAACPPLSCRTALCHSSVAKRPRPRLIRPD